MCRQMSAIQFGTFARISFDESMCRRMSMHRHVYARVSLMYKIMRTDYVRM